MTYGQLYKILEIENVQKIGTTIRFTQVSLAFAKVVKCYDGKACLRNMSVELAKLRLLQSIYSAKYDIYIL